MGCTAQKMALYSTGPRYQGIANTIVQLIRRSASGVVAASPPIFGLKSDLQRT
jgi:hypothetical protein